ncbi:hypothetical protein JVU11DRAFT_4992 [Chiua virens]|nr:hypothetical protein JVU11DRAFT_4992 [Chiua virens]
MDSAPFFVSGFALALVAAIAIDRVRWPSKAWFPHLSASPYLPSIPGPSCSSIISPLSDHQVLFSPIMAP